MAEGSTVDLGALDPKRPWASRGVVFGVVASLASVGALWGVEVDVASTTEVVMLGISALSGLLSAWGRWRAARPIRLRG